MHAHATVRTAVVLVAAALIASVLAAPADAAYPGGNGRIAFARDGKIIGRTGAGAETVLARSGASQPSWSADGTRVVFLRRDAADPALSTIWTMRAGGSDEKQLTSAPGRYSSPSFRPDGARIIVTQDGGAEGGNLHLFTLPVAGGALRRFAPDVAGSMQDGVYSPNGRRVAYAGGPTGTQPTLRTIRAGGDPATRKNVVPDQFGAFSVSRPDWSPDGSQLIALQYYAEQDREDVIRVEADGSDLRWLTNHASDQVPTRAVWSPSGDKILYALTTTFESTARDLVTMDPDGDNPTVLLSDGDEPSWQPRP